jgi:uncharacterized protein (DUF2062 family)
MGQREADDAPSDRAVPAQGCMKNSFLSQRLIRPILDLLRQGVAPEKLALSISLGIALGVFPALGTTTALCAVAALVLGLNLPAIQIVNYFAYPLQIALVVPFFRLGEKLFRAPHLPISVPQIYAMIHTNVWGAIRFLWTATWHAIVVWSLAAPAFVALSYFALVPLLRRALRNQVARASPMEAG